MISCHIKKISMKLILFALFIMLFSLPSCKKNNECINAEITKTIIKSCYSDTVWGVKLENITYPADFTDSITAAFKHEGLKVCIQYTVATYAFACPCCYGGPYARITMIKKAE